MNCSKAWTSLRQFESFYPNMNLGAELNEQYSSSRAQCLTLSKEAAEASGLNEGIALDAILLLDRLMHHSQEAFSQVHKLRLCLSLLSAICLYKNCLRIQLRKLFGSCSWQNATTQIAVWPVAHCPCLSVYMVFESGTGLRASALSHYLHASRASFHCNWCCFVSMVRMMDVTQAQLIHTDTHFSITN